MDREVARELEDLVGQAREVVEGVGRRAPQAGAGQGLGLDEAVHRQVLRGAIERGLGDAEHLADVAHGRARAVADDVAHHRGVVAAVDRCRRAGSPPRGARARCRDRCRAARRARATGSARTEAHAHRIDRGDAEAEAHRGVRGRAAALAQDVAPPAERHDLVHRQEVAGVVELLDQRELGRRAGGARWRDVAAVAPRGAVSTSVAQVLRRGRAVGQALRRVAIAQLAERERAARGDLERARDGGGIVGVERANACGARRSCSSLPRISRPAVASVTPWRMQVSTSCSGRRARV